ncbi:hypothetical protein [Dyadobacter psychrotolerans]|uniref:Uncharacterized protein n=1 Tax=Dyadobacter psychrotolerans TaxID=2541721 RepID=A0A4R5DHU4_9BACT|nr:hypothetical protein [Dyadobacter psychrotolerans]TDE12847.1 hypothetical protein E0F88_21110 [Dyadobacter psychrotolerans]
MKQWLSGESENQTKLHSVLQLHEDSLYVVVKLNVMFYITVIDDLGKVLTELEELDYESFIIRCYNFREDRSLDFLQVYYSEDTGKKHRLSSETLNEMIESWLDPDFMFTMGYPLPHW